MTEPRLPVQGTSKGAGRAIGRVIDGGEQVSVYVLDLHALRAEAHLDLAALVGPAAVVVQKRESDDHASDAIGEPRQGEPHPLLDVEAENVGHFDVTPPNLNLDQPPTLWAV